MIFSGPAPRVGCGRMAMSSSFKGSSAWITLWAGLVMGTAAAAAPPAAQPLQETVHGITISDEYRWMEEPGRAQELAAWIGGESAAARQALLALPERPAFESALKQLSAARTRVRDVQTANGTTLFRRTEPGDRVARLVLRHGGPGSPERVLLDPHAIEGPVRAIHNVSLSPDGRRVAVHTARGGSEVGEIQVHDVQTGRPVGPPMTRVWGEFALVWLGGDTVAYTRMAEPAAEAGGAADPLQGMRAHVKRLQDAGEGTPVLGGDTGPAVAAKDFPIISASPVSRWVLGRAGGARPDSARWVARKAELIAGQPRWQAVATLADRVSSAALLGDTLFMLSTRSNSAGTVLRRSLAGRGAAAAAPVFEGDGQRILTALATTAEGVYVAARSEGVMRLFFSRGGHSPFAEVGLPQEGGDPLDFRANPDGRGISFGHSGWFGSPRYLAVERGRVADTGLASAAWAEAEQFQLEKLQARSADGTTVPMVVLRRRGDRPHGGQPTVLVGYGSYGASIVSPQYPRNAWAWIARGGAMALCGTRGGGERGRAWHEAGRERNKPKAHADYIACAEALRAAGIAPAKGVVAVGTSAGGLLVPPAVMQRPELFAAMIPLVAVLNPSRLAAAPNGANQFDEMGDPSTPEGFRALVAQDAYLMLADAKALPPTLLTIGLNDRRVAPWMSAKFAARAQARFGAQTPIWLRADGDAGHGIGTAEDLRMAEFADMLAFAWQQSQ